MVLSIILLLLICCGDVESNPGPSNVNSSDSTLSLSSNDTSAFSKDINRFLALLHLNIQSFKPKLDVINAELKHFDILSFTESWLNDSILDTEILLDNFDPPFRKDRNDKPGGGVLVFCKDYLCSKRRNDLEINGIECLWIEFTIKSDKFLLGTFYRPPDSKVESWNLIEESIELAIETNIKHILITGDFNENQLTSGDTKIKNISNNFGLTQLITEPTSFSENASTLIDLLLTNDPDKIVYSSSSDVETNPGPSTSSITNTDTSSTISSLSACSSEDHHLFPNPNALPSLIHLNIQSLKPKIDLLEGILNEIDILSFSETWLNKNIENYEVNIQGYSPPFRCDRDDKQGGGVAVYVKKDIVCKRRTDLEVKGVECVWLEINIKHVNYLIGTFYRPPNSPVSTWNLIEHSFDLANDSNIRNIIILAKDLLHPSLEEERGKCKLKRLVQSPNSYFMDVKCPGCYKITTVFSHAQTVVLCVGCSTVLCQPTGGKARLTEVMTILHIRQSVFLLSPPIAAGLFKVEFHLSIAADPRKSLHRGAKIAGSCGGVAVDCRAHRITCPDVTCPGVT
ncbi:hypothetical protein FSP39_007176 [Pinctada imbricata]|uniref:40S ribosomal protein S27 n=1 Tax=Pinctada imbricata TaxID=66713 RepID=A0AA89BT68_PINIB|nr:hypothetical protein FSP39_007176 [Pinctada imbricata]